MAEIIAAITLLGSLLGMVIILFRKVPVLIEIPLEKSGGLTSPGIREKIKGLFFNSFSSEIFLQKFLRKIKILALKTENKISVWLERLQRKSENRKNALKENYWQDLKNSINSSGSQEETKKDPRKR